MRKETFLDRAIFFNFSRGLFFERLREDVEYREEVLQDIKIATITGTIEKYRFAILKYLDAMINNDKEAFDSLQKLCGKKIFKKLIGMGLTKIS